MVSIIGKANEITEMIGLDSFSAQDTEFETSGYNLFVLGCWQKASGTNHNSLPSLNMPFFNCGYYILHGTS